MVVHKPEGHGDNQGACVKYNTRVFKLRFKAVEKNLDPVTHLSISSSHRQLFIGRMGIEV